MAKTDHFDVAIIGGGPGGTTTGTLLKKYNPALKVVILEREKFPREHIGESQLPPIGRILKEMGAWEKIEACDFPVKLGATYTWGKTTEPWMFRFIPADEIPDHHSRPAPFEGWRTRVALQVDRAVYDDILLKHAAECGCGVREETRVVTVHHTRGHVDGLELENGDRITARYYVDASGNAAVLRRQLNVAVTIPTQLRNIAFWDYYERPGLNAPIWEKDATRIQIRSLPYGWIWYIAISHDRTSVGVVCPGEYYKASGRRPEQFYAEAMASEPTIARLTDGAMRSNVVRSTTDWSYISEETYGPNWFLCGETLGFADPILSAGMTLTHTCGQHCAYTILEIDRGEQDAFWLKKQYHEIQRKRVMQHIRFADYWYSANGFFDAIRENCTKIAEDAGLRLDPGEAFRWLSNGGLEDHPGQVAIGGLDLAGVKQVQQRFQHKTESGTFAYIVDGKSEFKLNLRGAEKIKVAILNAGRVVPTPAYRRGTSTLVLDGGFDLLTRILEQTSDAEAIVHSVRGTVAAQVPSDMVNLAFNQVMQCLEIMAANYWVNCSIKTGRPTLTMKTPEEGEQIYTASLGPPSKRVARASEQAAAPPGG